MTMCFINQYYQRIGRVDTTSTDYQTTLEETYYTYKRPLDYMSVSMVAFNRMA